MEILYKVWALVILSIISGVFGRLGGRAKDGAWYDFASKSWVRDWICPLIALIALWLLVGFKFSYCWVYLLIYGLTGLSLTTYYDSIFGYDNHWFAGFSCGLAFLPMAWCGVIWYMVIGRAVALALTWGLLNKYMPKKLFVWRGDIANEFLRYFSIVFSLFSPIEDKETLARLAITYEPFWNINNGETLCEDCHNKTRSFI